MRIVTIEVTKQDIAEGQANVRRIVKKTRNGGTSALLVSTTCAIALAATRRLKSPVRWFWTVGYCGSNTIKPFDPRRTEDFVTKHDALLRVKPFRFRARVEE